MSGYPLVIINDMLTIRPWGGSRNAWISKVDSNTPAASSVTATQSPMLSPGIDSLPNIVRLIVPRIFFITPYHLVIIFLLLQLTLRTECHPAINGPPVHGSHPAHPTIRPGLSSPEHVEF